MWDKENWVLCPLESKPEKLERHRLSSKTQIIAERHGEDSMSLGILPMPKGRELECGVTELWTNATMYEQAVVNSSIRATRVARPRDIEALLLSKHLHTET